MLSKEEQAELWGRVADGDQRAIVELVEAYQPLAHAIARKQNIPAHVDREDLTSNAMLGLFQAVTRFDPTKSDGNYASHFASFARQRISGQVLDYIKSNEVTWAPRGAWKAMKARHAAEEELEQSLGHKPNEHEIAAHMGVNVKDLPRIAIQVPMAPAISSDDDGKSLDTFSDSEHVGSTVELDSLGDSLAQAICRLPVEDQELLSVFITRNVPALRRPPHGYTQEMFDGALLSLMRELRVESISSARR